MTTVALDNGMQGPQYFQILGVRAPVCISHRTEKGGVQGGELVSPESFLELTQETMWNNLILKSETILQGAHLPLLQQCQHMG